MRAGWRPRDWMLRRDGEVHRSREKSLRCVPGNRGSDGRTEGVELRACKRENRFGGKSYGKQASEEKCGGLTVYPGRPSAAAAVHSPGTAACPGHVPWQHHRAADRVCRLRHRGGQRPDGHYSAERHADRGPYHPAPAVPHLEGRRPAAHRHGLLRRIHRRLPQHLRSCGRRSQFLQHYPGRHVYRRPGGNYYRLFL